MKENDVNLNIENNKECEINVVVNKNDTLSYNSINESCSQIANIEEEFSDRINFGANIMSKKVLPKELQNDFEIVPTFVGNKLEYETKAKTPEAYVKFPMRIDYTMQFDSIEEKEQFRQNGIEKLLKQAEETQKPVEIPNIINMKEFLGNYLDPNGYANKYGSEGIKLYIAPSPRPPAQRFKIDVYNDLLNFSLETYLRSTGRFEDKIVLTNEESTNEKYDVNLSITDIKTNSEKKGINCKFNITITLREKYKNDSNCIKDIIKYGYLIEDSENNLIVKQDEENVTIFTFNKCGKVKHTSKQKQSIKKLISLIEKIIQIEKVKEINFSYTTDEIMKNEDSINIVYSDIFEKKCTIKNKMIYNIDFKIIPETREFCKIKKPLYIKTELNHIFLFNEKIKLKDNVMLLEPCMIKEVKKKKTIYKVKFESEKTIIIPKHKYRERD